MEKNNLGKLLMMALVFASVSVGVAACDSGGSKQQEPHDESKPHKH